MEKLYQQKWTMCAIIICTLISSCSITNRSMRSTSELLLLNVNDFELSDQVTAEATVVRVFGVDWNRLFKWETGTIGNGLLASGASSQISAISLPTTGETIGSVSSSIPIIGSVLKGNTSAYALNNLMHANPGYDMIIYPQYYRKKKVIPIFYSKTQVNVTARLGKLKNE